MDILIEELDGSFLAAALDQGQLVGFEVDPAAEEVRWGSIYSAVVKTMDKALDAAYLDLGNDQTGLIYNKDLRMKDADGTVTKGGAKAIGKMISPGDVITVQAKTAYMKRAFDGDPTFENKLPQMSMDITLPGRYLIYAPMLERNKISQRIKDKALRGLIRGMMDDMKAYNGFIIRSSAAFTQTDILVREASVLQHRWDKMFSETESQTAPYQIYAGPNAIQRTLSDQADQAIQTIEVTTMTHLDAADDWCGVFAPDLVPKITPIELNDASEDLALFYERDIVGQIESLFDAYCLMPGGGNVIIQKTAALTAIDVNAGGDKRGALAVNLEAVHEVARQLRLRNIGGAIVLDLLKFKNKTEEKKVLEALTKAVGEDPCTVQIHGKTNLGMIEITRKRRTPPLSERFSLPFV